MVRRSRAAVKKGRYSEKDWVGEGTDASPEVALDMV